MITILWTFDVFMYYQAHSVNFYIKIFPLDFSQMHKHPQYNDYLELLIKKCTQRIEINFLLQILFHFYKIIVPFFFFFATLVLIFKQNPLCSCSIIISCLSILFSIHQNHFYCDDHFQKENEPELLHSMLSSFQKSLHNREQKLIKLSIRSIDETLSPI